ncbi:hypothetical protein D3C72_1422580 [compost metagenome]
MRALRLGRTHSGRQQIHYFAVRLRNGVANNHLALIVVTHHAEHAADAFEGGAVDGAFVLQHKAQARHTVGNGDDVVFAAERTDNVFRQRGIIFGHRS